jgi:hypothetical protein
MFDYWDEDCDQALRTLAVVKSYTPQIARRLMIEGVTAALQTLVIDGVLYWVLGAWRPYIWLPLAILHVIEHRNDADYIQGLDFVFGIIAWIPWLWPPFIGDYNLFLSLDFFSFDYRHSKMFSVLIEMFGSSAVSILSKVSITVRHELILDGPWAVAPVYRFITGLVVLGIGRLLPLIGLF